MTPEIVFIGDSRLRDIDFKKYHGWKVRLSVNPSIELAELVKTANETIDEQTRILVLVGLHCDLTYRPRMQGGKAGLMHILKKPPFDDMCNLITTWNYQWERVRGITVIWTLPYCPDFLYYNERRIRTLGQPPLCQVQRDEAIWFAAEMRGNLQALARKLCDKHVTVLELHLLPYDLSPQSGSDGVHLGRSSRNAVFHEVVLRSLALYPVVPPPEVRKVKTPAARRSRQQRRQRRQMRRQAAEPYPRAESELYDPAAPLEG